MTGSGNKVSNSLLFDPLLCEIVTEIDAPRTYAVQASPNVQYMFTITGTGYLRKIEINGENSKVVGIRLVNLFKKCPQGSWTSFGEIHERPPASFGISPH